MQSLDKECQKGHERIVHFGDSCPLCIAVGMLDTLENVVESGKDLLRVSKATISASAPKGNVLLFPKPKELYAIDQPDGAA